FFAGLDENSDSSPHDHCVGARVVSIADGAFVQYPWATKVSLVVSIARNDGAGSLHVSLTFIDGSETPPDIIDMAFDATEVPVNVLREFTVDVTDPLLGIGEGDLPYGVFTYALDSSDIAITYAALRFEA